MGAAKASGMEGKAGQLLRAFGVPVHTKGYVYFVPGSQHGGSEHGGDDMGHEKRSTRPSRSGSVRRQQESNGPSDMQLQESGIMATGNFTAASHRLWQSSKPTNGQFILQVARYLHEGMRRCNWLKQTINKSRFHD